MIKTKIERLILHRFPGRALRLGEGQWGGAQGSPGREEGEHPGKDLETDKWHLKWFPGNDSKNNKVLITGPNANSIRTLNGGWSYSWQGEKADKYGEKQNTILEAIKNHIGSDQVIYEPGVKYSEWGNYNNDEIVSIEPLGKQQVYDLSIDATHNLIANDICVHNTTPTKMFHTILWFFSPMQTIHAC